MASEAVLNDAFIGMMVGNFLGRAINVGLRALALLDWQFEALPSARHAALTPCAGDQPLTARRQPTPPRYDRVMTRERRAIVMTTEAPVATETVVEAHDLHKTFGDREAVRGVSLTIRGGEIFGLLGPNGAGKSTTINMLATYLAPTSGTATVAGMPSRPGRASSG